MSMENLSKYQLAENKEINKHPEESREDYSFFEGLEPLMATIAQDSSLRIRLANHFDFNHQSGEVGVAPSWFLEKGLNLEKGRFCFGHEIAHYIQLVEDPEGYLRQFAFAEERAKQGKDETEQKILEQIYHEFFNVFSDINANQIIIGKVSNYQKNGSEEQVPHDIYRDNLFSDPNYTEDPFFAQFLYGCLRPAMVPEEEVQLSPEVARIIQEGINYFGKNYSWQELIDKFIRPADKTNTDINFCLEHAVLPVFEKLIEEDRKNGRLRPIKITGTAPGSEEARKGAAEKITKERADQKKTGRERSKEQAAGQLGDKLKNEGFNEQEINRVLAIKEKCDQYLNELKDFWYDFINISTSEDIEESGPHKRGVTLNLLALIREFPKILTRPEEAEIMDRREPLLKQEILPKEIVVQLVADLSGSMDLEKRQAVQEAVYSLATSLYIFQAEQISRSDEAKPLVTGQCQVYGFGSGEESPIILIPKESEKDRTAEIARGVINIEKIDLVGTEDDKPLLDIDGSITREELEKIAKGEQLNLVIEITDGDTTTANQTIAILHNLRKKGIGAKGIQVAGPLLPDKRPENPEEWEKLQKEMAGREGTFATVWGNDGLRLKRIALLKNVLMELLKEFRQAKQES